VTLQPGQPALRRPNPDPNRNGRPDLPTLSARIDHLVRRAKVRAKATAVPIVATNAPAVDPAATEAQIVEETEATVAIAAKADAPAADVPSTVPPTSNSKS